MKRNSSAGRAAIEVGALACAWILGPAAATAGEGAWQRFREPLDFTGYYKNLFGLTNVRDNYRAMGLIDRDAAVDDYQRLRLKFDYQATDAVDLQVHYEVLAAWGDSVRINRELAEQGRDGAGSAGLAVLPAEPQRFLDLERTLIEASNFTLGHQLDRLRLRVTGKHGELLLGRQAVSWGSGLIWNPVDFFAGFAPTEIDRDEKPGVDVLRVTWNPNFDSYVEVVAEPLDDEEHYHVDENDSSLAGRAGTHVGEYEAALLGGYVASDTVLGMDFTGYLRDAGFRGEAVYTWVDEDADRDYFRGLLSLDYAFAARYDPYVLVEYFYNGLGTDDPDAYLERLAVPSVERAFARGNAYNIGRHYLGGTVRLTLTALVQARALTLWNLGDGSLREYASLDWSMTQNLDFQLGANFGIGPLGREFTGYTEEQAGMDFAHPDLYFAYLKYYF